MGWPLAVAAGPMDKSSRALVAALGPLTLGHLLAILVVILPFSLLVALVYWQRQIDRASFPVIGFGSFRLVNRRHPRALARIRPTQRALAICRGDRSRRGIDARTVYLGLPGRRSQQGSRGGRRPHQRRSRYGHRGLRRPRSRDGRGRRIVSVAGDRDFGPKFVSRSWFNLDATWAVSLLLVGALSLAICLADRR